MDILKAAGFVEAEGNLVLDSTAAIGPVSQVLLAVQQHVASVHEKRSQGDSKAREQYLQEAKRKKTEADARKAAALSKIQSQRKEEKEMLDSKSQHRGFKAGERKGATELGAAGDDKGGG